MHQLWKTLIWKIYSTCPFDFLSRSIIQLFDSSIAFISISKFLKAFSQTRVCAKCKQKKNTTKHLRQFVHSSNSAQNCTLRTKYTNERTKKNEEEIVHCKIYINWMNTEHRTLNIQLFTVQCYFVDWLIAVVDNRR